MNIEQQAEQELQRTLSGFWTLDHKDQQAAIQTRIAEWRASGVVIADDDNDPHQPRERELQAPPVPALPALPAADTPIDELRDKLRHAQEQQRQAVHQLAEARVLAERASERLAHSQAELHHYDDLDHAVEDHEWRTLRDGEDARLPYDLKRQLEARSIARDRAERAASAHTRAAHELQAAEAALAHARQAVNVAAQHVAVAEAREFLPAIVEAEAELVQFKRVLASLQLPTNMPADIVNAISRQLPAVRSDPALVKRWREHMARLRQDATAEFHWQDNERDGGNGN